MTSAYGYSFHVGARGCRLEAVSAFVAVMLSAFGERGLPESARKSDDRGGRRLSTRLYGDVLVLRCTRVL